MFHQAHDLGMFTVLWCYLRNPRSRPRTPTITSSADLTGQANHLGVTIQADIIKQKLPENNGGFTALNFGKTDKQRLLGADDRIIRSTSRAIKSSIAIWDAPA